MSPELQLEIIKVMVVRFVAAVVCEHGKEKQDEAFLHLVRLAAACIKEKQQDEASEKASELISKLMERV
ncbi:MAG: hypothetical protein JZU60_02595 [Ilumatobacteraceae bacterium]|nr:hypothetical protein [Ilumatobacteraceae bacterium]